jgi:cytochrome c-type biogenesis protein CcmH
MLARSYQVLERPQDALAAYRRAGDLAPEDIDVKILEARLLRQMAGERPTEESVALMREVAALDPDNTEANWFLGLDALRAGDRETARTLLRRALSGLPEGSGQRDELAREVERLLAD